MSIPAGVGRDDPHDEGGPSRAPVRLAILDDHEMLLDSLASWIQVNANDFDLVLSAANWLQLVHSPHFPTELVFLDLQVNEPVSIEARVRTCRAAGAKVIVLTGLDSVENRERSLAAGAADFVSKSASMSQLMDAARRVMGLEGGRPPQKQWRPLPMGATAAHPRPRLSPGEEEALRHYVAGLSTAEVASKMNVQYETAKTYLRRVREKYARVGRPAGKKADLIRRAAEDGYLQ